MISDVKFDEDAIAELRDIRVNLAALLDRIDNVDADVAGLCVDAAVTEPYRLFSDDPGDWSVPSPENLPKH